MHTPMHCPLHYSNPILQGVGHMKNWPSKMDLFLKFMLKTFEIQTFFGYNPLLGSYLAHIKKYFESFIVYYAKQPTFGEQNIPFLRVILYWCLLVFPECVDNEVHLIGDTSFFCLGSHSVTWG